MMRRAASSAASAAATSTKCVDRPAPERVAGADVDDDDAIVGRDAGAREPLGDRRGGAADRPASRPGSVDAIRRRDAERRRADPTGSRPSAAAAARAAARTRARVHPAAPGDLVADAHAARRSATSAATRAARRGSRSRGRSAARRSRRPSARSASRPRDARAARRDDHLVEVRVVGDDRRRGRLDEIGEVRVGKSLAQRAHGRRREDDVADLRAGERAECFESVCNPHVLHSRSSPRR